MKGLASHLEIFWQLTLMNDGFVRFLLTAASPSHSPVSRKSMESTWHQTFQHFVRFVRGINGDLKKNNQWKEWKPQWYISVGLKSLSINWFLFPLFIFFLIYKSIIFSSLEYNGDRLSNKCSWGHTKIPKP